jgi:hypothetical protein
MKARNYEGLTIKSVADALALIFLLEEQLDVSLVPEIDKEGNSVPKTAVMKFNDPVIVTKLCDWMKVKTKKVTKTKSAFVSDDALMKILYLTTMNIVDRWTMLIQNWGSILDNLMIFFGEIVKIAL